MAVNSSTPDYEGAEAATASQPFAALPEGAIAAEVDNAPTLDPDWLKKPEAVVLATFAVLLVLWQLYLELLEEAGADAGWSGIELARHLGVSYSTVQRRKRREDFAQWSRTLDPDRLSWQYENGRFFPLV